MDSIMRTVLAVITVISLAILPAAAAAASPKLALAAESESMIWNGVAVVGERVFVSGPRWTGSKGPTLCRSWTVRALSTAGIAGSTADQTLLASLTPLKVTILPS